WLLTDKGDYASRYPPGLALVVATIWKLFGWRSAMLITPTFAMLALVGTFVIVRRLLSPAWALGAVVALAINPAFAEYALTDIAHMPVACFLVWGVALLLEWSARGKW